jgi:hypothetical protein
MGASLVLFASLGRFGTYSGPVQFLLEANIEIAARPPREKPAIEKKRSHHKSDSVSHQKYLYLYSLRGEERQTRRNNLAAEIRPIKIVGLVQMAGETDFLSGPLPDAERDSEISDDSQKAIVDSRLGLQSLVETANGLRDVSPTTGTLRT